MKRKRLYFDDWLKEQLKNPRLKKAYEQEDVRARLAVRITELRREKKLSQAELARRLHTTQQVVSDIETFRHANLTLLTIQKIAQALNSRLVVDLV
jgi:ribosome-binding protein aMBF1 (putative translation factor)